MHAQHASRRQRLRRVVVALLAFLGTVTGLAHPEPAVAAATGSVAIATGPDGSSTWVLRADGRVVPPAGAANHGDVRGWTLQGPPRSLVPTPTHKGYWIMGDDGGVFTFGDARFHGSTGAMRLNAPVVGMAATPSGKGYWLVASDGGIFTFGDARFHGSTGAMRLNKPVVGMAATPSGKGYWLVASDGGIFTFGDARFHGSTGAMRLNAPVIGMAATPSGKGYWLVASDGGIFTFGDARFHGSAVALGSTATGMATTTSGYAVLLRDGRVVSMPPKGGTTPLQPSSPPVRGPHTFLYRPAGSTAPPGRWDPCRPVRLEVNYAGHLQPDARTTLPKAIEAVEARTGLDLQIVGETTARTPSSKADAIVYWATPGEDRQLGANVLGYAGGTYGLDGAGRYVVRSGFVVFNRNYTLFTGFAPGGFGTLALHELGHLVGLGHVDDKGQVMHPTLQPLTGYANGDREGLWWLGSAQGCMAGGQSVTEEATAAELPGDLEWTVVVPEPAPAGSAPLPG